MEDVVEQRQSHQPGQQREAHVLSGSHRTLAQWAALDQLDKVVQEVSTVQERDGQEVEDRQTERQQGEEVQEPTRPELRGGIGGAGRGDQVGVAGSVRSRGPW